jgi:hypothetical protein
MISKGISYGSSTARYFQTRLPGDRAVAVVEDLVIFRPDRGSVVRDRVAYVFVGLEITGNEMTTPIGRLSCVASNWMLAK